MPKAAGSLTIAGTTATAAVLQNININVNF
jgi:hypothetical protein